MSVAGIVIAQYGQVELTLRCLGTLRQFHPAIPIVIVDDGSPSSVDRRPLQLIADRHTTLLALPQRHGVTYAWNRGARWFQRNHAVQTLIFLNNDTITHGPWVEPLIEPLLESSALLSGAAWRAERRLPAIIHDLGRSHILAGWCLAIRTETFAILNEFDKRLRLYFSDTDLQCRLLLTSRDTTTPALALVSELPLEHTGHQSTSLLPDRRELWARDFDVFQRKWSARTTASQHATTAPTGS
ncbi:MAG: glycosyltransferase [Planctomycetaceae bacterium]|nr:glycosyltransferase [Planctomycetaceae bacterium]